MEEDNDKPTVLALREIAAGMVDETILDEQPEEAPDEGALEAEWPLERPMFEP